MEEVEDDLSGIEDLDKVEMDGKKELVAWMFYVVDGSWVLYYICACSLFWNESVLLAQLETSM
jgi:hypothetical protein